MTPQTISPQVQAQSTPAHEPGNAMPQEIERRFLLHDFPESWLDAATSTSIDQGYLIIEAERSLRIRKRAGRYTMTSKSGTGLCREEAEQEIPAALFEMLWPLTDRFRVQKQRHTLRDGAHILEVDIFSGPLAPLKILEIEFPSTAAAHAYQPPPFVGREVTDDGRFTNAALAHNGLPPGWEHAQP